MVGEREREEEGREGGLKMTVAVQVVMPVSV
jgi:hypothetical protein